MVLERGIAINLPRQCALALFRSNKVEPDGIFGTLLTDLFNVCNCLSSTGMSEDCISSSHNSTEIRKEVKSDKDHDAFYLLRNQRSEYPKNVIFGHLNINSL